LNITHRFNQISRVQAEKGRKSCIWHQKEGNLRKKFHCSFCFSLKDFLFFFWKNFEIKKSRKRDVNNRNNSSYSVSQPTYISLSGYHPGTTERLLFQCFISCYNFYLIYFFFFFTLPHSFLIFVDFLSNPHITPPTSHTTHPLVLPFTI